MSAAVQTPTLADLQRLFQAGDLTGAVETGWEVLRADPRDATVLSLLALAEHRRGNHPVGVVLLQRAVKACPENPTLWNDLGNLYLITGDLAKSEEAYRTALALDERGAEVHNNLAVLLSKRGDHAAARALLEKALALKPGYADALYNMGNALAGLGRFQKALRRYEQAAEANPVHPGTHFNLGITRLVLGDLTGGWLEWEWRWRSTLAPFKRDFVQPAWQGELLRGARLLLYAEQGIGDTLQFLRYVPLVRERGATVVLEVQRPLVRLLKGYPAVAEVVARGDALPDFDLHCSLMSLGAVFRTKLTTIPAAQLSFQGIPKAAAKDTPLRVGIAWAGNPTHERDQFRSMTLAAFTPLFDVAGIEWFSLQKGDAALELTDNLPVRDLARGFTDYADTAAALQSLDLIIAVDTSVVHLAGAMGKPVWILLPAIPDWRWLLKRGDSPWYPTARLFRQSEPGEWGTVIDAVRLELVRLTSCRSGSQ